MQRKGNGRLIHISLDSQRDEGLPKHVWNKSIILSQERRRRRGRGPAAKKGGTAAGIYDFRRLQFKRCAELDEAARLRLTVAGDIREHPRKRPDRWVRAGITFMHPDGLSVNFGYRRGKRKAKNPRLFRFSRHPWKTTSAFPPVCDLFAAPVEDVKNDLKGFRALRPPDHQSPIFPCAHSMCT